MRELNLTLEHLTKSYTRPVLKDINLHVTNDSYITIVGKSGSGKSTYAEHPWPGGGIRWRQLPL